MMTDMTTFPLPDDAIAAVLDQVKFTADGLVPAIAQQHDSGEVLMMAWMNRDSIRETLRSGRACYWSRSRNAFWRKGDTSGQVQNLIELRLDCDGDTILLRVNQLGVACHTGRRSCFYRRADNSGLTVTEPVLMSPDALYGNGGTPGF